MNNRKFSKNALIYIIGGAIAAGGNVLLTPLYLSFLTALEYGLWMKFCLALQFAQPIMGWGMSAAITRFLTDTDGKNRKNIICAGLIVVTALNLILLVLIGIVTSIFPSQKFMEFNYLELNLFGCAGIVAALFAYPSILMGVFISDGKAMQYRGMSLIGFMLQIVVITVWSVFGRIHALTAIYAMIVSTAIYAVVSTYKLFKESTVGATISECRLLFAFGAPLAAYTILGQSSDLFVKYTLSVSIRTEEFGSFSAAMLYASVISMVASAVNLAWIPRFYQKANEWIANGVYQKFAEVIATGLSVLCAGMIVFSEELLAIYSIRSVNLDSSIVGMLVVASWLNSTIWMGLTNPLFFGKRTKTILFITLLATFSTAPVVLIWIKTYGVYGASISLLCNAFIVCLLAGISLRLIKIPLFGMKRLLISFALLIFISSPVFNVLYDILFGSQKIMAKIFVLIIYSFIVYMVSLRRNLNVLRLI